MINLDFTDIPSREALPEGIYDLQIAKVEKTTSSAGNPMIKVEFDVLEVEGNRKIWENYVLVKQSLWKIRDFLGALGFEVNASLEFDEQELVGLTCVGKIIQDEYNGQTVNRLDKII